MNERPFAWLEPHGRPWRAGPPRRLVDNPWFAVDQFAATAPTGAPADYYVQHFKNLAVGALPLHDDGRIVLVGQWRFPFGAYSWELPEGGCPVGEAALDGARRELREEAGLEAGRWRHILTLHLSNASSDEQAMGFLATDLTETDRALEPTEELAVARPHVREAIAAAAAGHIKDAITVAMLFRLHHMAYNGELEPPLARLVLGA